MGEGITVTRVIIYNRIGWNDRLSNSRVSLLNYQGNTLKSYRIGDATSTNMFNISFDVQKVRVQQEGYSVVHMREVQVFDYDNVNKALGKIATQSSMWDQAYPAAQAVNGILNNDTDFSHTDWQTGKLITLCRLRLHPHI